MKTTNKKDKTTMSAPTVRKEFHKKHHSETAQHTFAEQVPLTFTGSTTGNTYTLSVNPGDLNMLPRLSKLSQAWTRYRFTKLTARWVPNGSAFAANNQTGEVVLNFSSNWYTAASPSISVARSKQPSRLGNAWVPFSLECDGYILSPWRYLRGDHGSGGKDVRLSDLLCELVICATPNTGSVGYVEFHGEVEFKEPYAPNIVHAPRTNMIYATENVVPQNATTGVDLTLAFVSDLSSSHLSGVTRTNSGSPAISTFRLAAGTFRVSARAYCGGTTITAMAMSIIPVGNVQAIGNGITNYGGSSFSVAAWTGTEEAVITVAEDESVCTFTVIVRLTGTGALTVQNCDLIVQPVG